MQRAHGHSKIPKPGCKDLKLEKPRSGKGKVPERGSVLTSYLGHAAVIPVNP